MMITKLCEIGIACGTDKATHHKFTEFYEKFFSEFKSPSILEIGVLEFKSIQMYLDYFESPYILGVDINDKKEYEKKDTRFKFKQADQSNIEDLKKVTQGEDLFDIILDDGGHTMKQQQISFGYLIDYVKPGGYYFIEDLHTSFRPGDIDPDCQITTFDLLQNWKNGKQVYSNYISEEKQKLMIEKIDFIDIFIRDKNNMQDSITSAIKIK